ncbi:hypothetical protein [Nocardia farcinica]|uniref:hypothetical protein n=1 Tax=Nocardia farcinica TaxID=37329 RepID=UPI002454B4DE|nr:hypothetical protein [Nocardia farcinica]
MSCARAIRTPPGGRGGRGQPQFDHELPINLEGTILLTRQTNPALPARTSPAQDNISSTTPAARLPPPAPAELL